MSPPDDVLRRIQSDTAAAMKAGDKARVGVLRMLASDLKKAAIDAGVDAVAGDAATAVLRRAAKMRADAAEQYAKAGRSDLAEKERAEIAVLETLQPPAASDADIAAAVERAVTETGATGPRDMGRVMKAVMAALAGKTADGRAVNEAVRARLNR